MRMDLRQVRSGFRISAAPVAKRLISSKLIMGIGAVLIVAASIRSAAAQGPGWTANSTVVKLVVTAAGVINVRLFPDLTGCVAQSGYGPNFASIYPSHLDFNSIKADLLAAYLSGSTVSLYLGDSSCTVSETILGGW